MQKTINFESLQNNMSSRQIIGFLKQKLDQGFQIVFHFKKKKHNKQKEVANLAQLPSAQERVQSLSNSLSRLLSSSYESNISLLESQVIQTPEHSAQKPQRIISNLISSLNEQQGLMPKLHHTSSEGNLVCDKSFGQTEINLEEHQSSEQNLVEQESTYKITQNPYFVQLKQAIDYFEQGMLAEAKTQMQLIYNDTFSICQNYKKQTSNQQEYRLICIQSQADGEDGGFLVVSGKQLFLVSRVLEKMLVNFEISDNHILGQVYLELGLISFLDFKLNRANSFYYEALLIFEGVNHKLGIAKCLLKLSHTWAFLLNINDAKKLCYEAIDMFRKLLPQNDVQIAESYEVLGEIFLLAKEYEIAKEYLERSLSMKKAKFRYCYPNNACYANAYNLLGLINYQRNEISTAIQYFEWAMQCIENSQTIMEAQILNNLGLAYVAKDRYSAKSQICFQEALKIYQTHSEIVKLKSIRTRNNMNLCWRQRSI